MSQRQEKIPHAPTIPPMLPLRIVKRSERKAPESAKVELGKIRRELLTIVSRIDKVTQGQD